MEADIVVISHLWWHWVWQRPQHLITRLARRHRVFWVEEPHIEKGPEWEGFELVEEAPGVTAGRLILRSDAERFWERLEASVKSVGGNPSKIPSEAYEASLMFDSDVQPWLEREVVRHVSSWRERPLVLWLYTPAVVSFIDRLKPDLIVYDVMDELTAFKYAPPRLRQQETELLERADLVFAGGPSLWESKHARRSDTHLFPSGVDELHFTRALTEDTPVPPEMHDLPHPIIGYYGVVDERIDYELLAAAAASRPEWSWVMLGPRLKVEPDTLPRLPNIHYLGHKEYEELPAYLRTFDVTMMPFALNESTRFISPTKTLEYMAGHKPIISTPIKDVISLYGEVVRIADTAGQFVTAAEAGLAESAEERRDRYAYEQALLQQHSWDNVADQMHELITERLAAKRR